MSLRFSGRSWLAWSMAALLMALAVGDVITTEYMLAHGGYEVNPIIAWGLGTFGHVATFTFKIVITLGIVLWIVGVWEYSLAKAATGIAIGMYSIIVGLHLFYIIGGYYD